MLAALVFAAACGTMTPDNVLLAYASVRNGQCSPTQLCTIGDDIEFVAFGKGYDFNCAPHTIEWDFHDHTPRQVGPVVRHSYGNPGYWGDVTLTITSPQQTLVLSEAIHVMIPPAGYDRFNPLWVTTYDNVVYCSFSPFPYEIDFGDGTVVKGTQTPVFHAYAKPGLYTITLAGGPPGEPWDAQVVIKSVPRLRGVRH